MNIYPVILGIIIFLLIIRFLSSCEKKSQINECINIFETFQDTDFYNNYYYDKCEKISNNDDDIENCMDEMRLSTEEMKEYCNTYIELNDNYDEYNEY